MSITILTEEQLKSLLIQINTADAIQIDEVAHGEVTVCCFNAANEPDVRGDPENDCLTLLWREHGEDCQVAFSEGALRVAKLDKHEIYVEATDHQFYTISLFAYMPRPIVL
jgi:hypothetical protein